MISFLRVPISLIPVLTVLHTLLYGSAASTSCVLNGHKFSVDEVVTRDITIIGGGSSGTYSAIRLRDLGKSVAVVEATGRLGGNTQTFTDPNTNATIELGVQVFHPFPVVTNYFARLGVASAIATIGGGGNSSGASQFADFKTGKFDPTFSPGDMPTALAAYAALVAQFPFLDFGWVLPDPVPADLLLPFGQFAKKNTLDAMVPFVWYFAQGIGDILSIPTVYVMKYLGISSLTDLETGFLVTALHDNSLLYLSAQSILGSDVLYNSTILSVQRDNDGVRVVVQEGSKLTLIKSSQIVVAIPPTLDNLRRFDTTHEENRIFKQFKHTEYFTALLRNTGIPSNVSSLTNVSPGAPFSLPSPPSLYSIDQTGVPGLVSATYISTTPTVGNTIPEAMISQIKKVVVPGKGPSDPVFADASNHRPFELSVSGEAIKNGFYRDLYALQGKERTWWTGAAWHAHDSSLIWRFTEGLLGNITAAAT